MILMNPFFFICNSNLDLKYTNNTRQTKLFNSEMRSFINYKEPMLRYTYITKCKNNKTKHSNSRQIPNCKHTNIDTYAYRHIFP